jgi:hypothetical protein
MIYQPKLSKFEDPNTPDIVRLNLKETEDLIRLNKFINSIDISRDSEALKTYFGVKMNSKQEIISKFNKTFEWVKQTNGEIFIATFEQEVIGFSLYNIRANTATTSTFIDSRVRGYNLGTGLLFTCISSALANQDVRAVLNYVKKDNLAAKKIVEKVLKRIDRISVNYFVYDNSTIELYEVTNSN